jgi:hypothetical protein
LQVLRDAGITKLSFPSQEAGQRERRRSFDRNIQWISELEKFDEAAARAALSKNSNNSESLQKFGGHEFKFLYGQVLSISESGHPAGHYRQEARETLS